MKLRVCLFALAFSLAAVCNSSAAPLAYGNYYDESATMFCSSAATCQLVFGQTPSDKLVMIRNVNCAIRSGIPVNSGYLLISTTVGGATISRWLPLPIPSPIVAGNSYATNLESGGRLLIGPGRFPTLSFNATAATDISLICTISGDLIAPVQ
ncbi:hypothetical protein RAD16_21170 [Bradyrhizobium sp. 18BD]